MFRYITAGFTLVELIVVLAVAAIMLSVGLPAAERLVQSHRLTAATNHFNASLQFARSEAVTRGWEVVVCTTGGSPQCRQGYTWDDGWMVFHDRDRNRACLDADGNSRCDGDDGQILLVDDGYEKATIRIDGGNGNTASRVVYEPTGYSDGYAGTFSICDERGSQAARGLVLSMTGRIRLADVSRDNISCGG